MRNSKMARRFEELSEQLKAVLKSKRAGSREYNSGSYYVDEEMLINWSLKAKNVILQACGESSLHIRAFEAAGRGSLMTNYDTLIQRKAVFEAAKEDYEGGYCNSVRSLIQAEVFESELDQARQLFDAGYMTAAAVIAGTVLETTLRELCDRDGLPRGKLDKMNADLSKAGVYNLLVQKRITALADIRNNAAHGNSSSFASDDVRDMIQYIESFVGERLSI